MLGLIASSMWLMLSGEARADDDASYLTAILQNRSGGASADARHDDHIDVGPLHIPIKTGCSGNTFSAGVTLQNLNISQDGAILHVSAHYDGSYTRIGWNDPCVQGGHEDHHVYGDLLFDLTNRRFQPPLVVWKGAANQGEVGDPGHNSNKFAVQAAQNAVMSAFK